MVSGWSVEVASRIWLVYVCFILPIEKRKQGTTNSAHGNVGPLPGRYCTWCVPLLRVLDSCFNPQAPTRPGSLSSYSSNSKSHGKAKGDKKGMKITKSDIGLPINFVHVQHIGWDPNTGFDVRTAEVSSNFSIFFRPSRLLLWLYLSIYFFPRFITVTKVNC